MSFDCSSLKGLRKRLCEGWIPDKNSPGSWRPLTGEEHARYIALFSGRPIPPMSAKLLRKNNPNIVIEEGVGTELEHLFEGLRFSSCGRCAQLKREMNEWGADGCEERKSEIVKRLEDNAKQNPAYKALYSKTAAIFFVEMAIENWRLKQDGKEIPKSLIGNVVKSVVSKVTNKVKSKPSKMTWAYGVTTVPSRKKDLLPKTLESLKKAGFSYPHLFIDQCTNVDDYRKFNLKCTVHDGIGAYGNWVTALWELYTASPEADRYAIFQDDFITCYNLKEYLEKSAYPEKGYLNLYTFPQNHKLIKNKENGWHVASQSRRGLGAVALVFSNEAAVKLLVQPHMVGRVTDKKRGHKFIDGGVVDAFRKIGWKEYVHNPSLVQHTGDVRTLGAGKQPKSPSFPGEEFDAMSLLTKGQK